MNTTSGSEHGRSVAREVLSEIDTKRFPVSLPKIARELGLSIEYTPLDIELSGMAFIKDGQKLIWVNALHHPNRQRFTLAHEIGHHVMHHKTLEESVHVDKGILRRDTISATGIDHLEIQANAFASELLMPASEVQKALAGDFDLDDQAALEALAKKFKVSVAALQFRLMNFD